MIVYVDIEHTRVKENNPKQWQQHLVRTLDAKYKLEEVSGEPCLIVHYENLTPALLRQLQPTAVLVSGNSTEFQHYEEEKLTGLRTIFREAAQPIIGFCGGAMMLAETFGGKAAAIDPTGLGSMADGSWKERTHEFGFMPISQVADHPLLAGLGSEFIMMQAHYWEIKSVPKGFKNFAETDITAVQLLAHDSLPLFATQFHPESWDNEHTDGRTLLKNFFNFAKG